MSGSVQAHRAFYVPVRQKLARGLQVHQEVTAGVEPYWKEDTERGGRTGCLSKVLLCYDIGAVIVWDGDLGVVGANGADARGGLCGVPETGEKVEGKSSEVWFMAEDGGGQNALGRGSTIAPDLLGQESNDSGGISVITAHH